MSTNTEITNEKMKKNMRVGGIKNLNALVKSNEESNNKSHRPQIQFSNKIIKEYRMNSGQNQNEKLAPKPLLDCLQPEPLLVSKPYEKSMSQRRRKNKPFDPENLERSNDDQVNKPDISPGKSEIGRSTIDIRQPTTEHLLALKNTFNKILLERFLSDKSLKQREIVFMKLREIITNARPVCQVNLYGSIYFECCLEKPGIMDIDINFKETLQHDTLKELYEIIKKSDLCKEIQIDGERKPSCINLITKEPNMRVKLTSGYNRGINLSKLIRIYTKFDSRVIKLLRLFRILTKICDIDKPEVGTLHPVVYHIMVIHFLQQLNEPVLPCLHEYVYGIDHVPITLNENQYSKFFHICKTYSSEWKSKNTTNVEMLFLQLLSYYVKTFNTKQFVVSIQTRMPVVKNDKNWHSRKLLVEDPTDIKRSLCQTMQSVRSIDYFRDTLNAALNYFGRKQKPKKKSILNKCSTENSDDDLIEIITEDENDIPIKEPTDSLHNSYRLFYKRLPATVARDINIKQPRVREYYRQTFNNKKDLLPKIILQKNSLNDKFDNSDENDIQEAFQHDLENNFETMDENDDDMNDNHLHLLEKNLSNEDYDDDYEQDFQQINIEQKDDDEEGTTEEFFPIIDEESQSTENSSSTITNNTEQENQIDDKTIKSPENLPVLIKSNSSEIDSVKPSSLPIPIETNINDKNDVPSPFISPINLEQILDNEKKLSTENSEEFFYDFQPDNFHAEQGAPYVCTTCNGIGHLKHECPELILPTMINLPTINQKWIEILSLLSRQITTRCKPTSRDIEKREEILNQLEKQFRKDYPDCNLHAFGSFYNGFGFQQSDLDVCIVFKDQREENNDQVIRIMEKILRAMRSSNTFERVQPVLHAKVPIIRSRHRQLHIEIDISLHNMLAIENTRLLKTYTDIDPRVSELGYMIKHLAKLCRIGDASRGTISSYAYIIMLIHFLQQIQPPILPVLQQLSDSSTKKDSMYKKCSKWNVYFCEDLKIIKNSMKQENKLTTGALWIEFLRFYTEQFNYEEHVVTIKQYQPLFKHEKGWFRQTIAIEDPFELSHNLAGGLSIRNWAIIRRVFIRARQQFGVELKDIDISKPDITMIEEKLFNIDELCPEHAPKRCVWCKGLDHIRKRCPKLASLAHENGKKQQIINNSEGGHFKNNHYHDNYYYNSSMNGFQYYNNNTNGAHPQTTLSNHRSLRTSTKDGSREIHNSTYPTNNSHRSHQYTNRKECFTCGSTDHLKLNCPNSKKNNQVSRQKSAT